MAPDHNPDAGTAQVALALRACLVVVLPMGCNAFDDGPQDRPPQMAFDSADPTTPANRTTPASTMTAPTVRPTSMTPEGCFEQPGLRAFSGRCTACMCEVDPAVVLGCNTDCFGLIQCVSDLCNADGSDIACIAGRCVNFLSEASSATELGNLMFGECAAVCDGEPAPSQEGCLAPTELDTDADADAGADCGATIPEAALPDFIRPDDIRLVLDQGFGPGPLSLFGSLEECGDDDAWVLLDEAIPFEVALCPMTCARVRQGARVQFELLCTIPPID